MKKRIIALVFCSTSLAVLGLAQTAELPASAPVEKELAAHASNVDEVTLGKNMLGLASAFMKGKDKDDAETRKMIEGLDGIYVRDYEFAKQGEFSAEQVEQLRKYYETTEWSPIVRDHDSKTGESADIMIKMVNGKSDGLFILDVEPKEISIVLILGPVNMEQLGQLKNLALLGALNGAKAAPSGNGKH
ncbi:MAG: DUF4252 domain-containing protein [Terracidiphilus sp.]|jgi:hypothetical protein